jgi:tetratricopeptide (TPR) repeat protein
LLKQSEELHQSALQLSLEAFGEVNVQTAKHYGNLGRLYQSMEKYEKAEKMHKKAIKIKTDLLGPYDYEVGLSIGHLASLYNYHMKKHREAEELYLKSIDISEYSLFFNHYPLKQNKIIETGLRLFGATYSGLEYDYRGLCHVYEEIGDTDKYFEYANVLEDWRHLRAENGRVSEKA